MQRTESTVKYKDLPDTITVNDYMKWRGCGRPVADAVFHAEGFPRIKHTGNKLLADKRAVLIYELDLPLEEKQEFLKELAKNIM